MLTSVSGMDSISTSYSFGDGDYDMKDASDLRRIATSLKKKVEVPSEEFQYIIAREAEGVLKRSEIMLAQEHRMKMARERRENLKKEREISMRNGNRRKEEIRISAKARREAENSQREQASFDLRRSNEEHVMLRKIYKGLLHKMHEWRADKGMEARQRVSTMRDDAKKHISALQTLFEDRVKILREAESNEIVDGDTLLRAHRKRSSDVRRVDSQERNMSVKSKKRLEAQKRDHELLMRREAHKNLLSLLSSEDWTESLRFDAERARHSSAF